MTIAIHHGDCLEVIPRLVAEGVVCDAVVTDPPYGLEFMGQAWDSFRGSNTGIKIPKTEGPWARDKGAPVFDANRRNQKCPRCGKWAYDYPKRKCVCGGAKAEGRRIYCSGFQEFTGEWARLVYDMLKPGGFLVAFGGTRTHHRMVCGLEDAGFVIQDTICWLYGSGFPKNKAHLKPAHEPICLAYKPGGKRTMQVDEGRIGADAITIGRRGHSGDNGIFGDDARKYERESLGRWPANVAHDGSDEVLAAFPESNGQGNREVSARGRRPGGFGNIGSDRGDPIPNGPMYSDSGSAARFFYTAKADKQDRWGSRHPTVKPIDLICWLVRLVTPPGGLVLDPFAGSGTTGAAAFAEGRNAILIEREDQYVADIRERMGWYDGGGMHSTAAKARRTEDKPLGGLFDMAPT